MRNGVGDDCSMVAGCKSSQDMYWDGVALTATRAVVAAASEVAPG